MQRRDFLAVAGASVAFKGLMSSAFAQAEADLAVAGYPFEHVGGLSAVRNRQIDFQTGRIGDLNTHVFSGPRTLDVTEIGLSPYLLAYANEGFRDYTLIPVFPLRTFRHKSIFINVDSGIEGPADLKGKRIGTPGYSSTSLTWIRGILQDEYDVRPDQIEWVLADRDSASGVGGSASSQEQKVPDRLTATVGPKGKDESDLLVDGDVDALFHAAEPRAFVERNPKVRRLFPNPRDVEADYFARTGIFPIMHAVAIRTDLMDSDPGLPAAVFAAYSAAKARSYAAMRETWFLRTLPWFAEELEATQALMGENFAPYGVEANRDALRALFRYSHQQGLASRQVEVDEIFAPSTLALADV